MKLLVAVTISLAVCIHAENPGFRFKITDKLLDGIKSLAQEVTEKRVEGLPKKFKSETMAPGVQIKSMSVKEHETGHADIKFQPPNVLHVEAHGGKLAIEAEMDVAGSEGKATATLAGVNFEFGLAFGRENNRLTLSKTVCFVNLTKFEINTEGFEGNNEVQQMTHTYSQQIKMMVESMMCPQAEMGLAAATGALQSWPIHMPILNMEDGQGLVMDVSLVADPVATNTHMQMDMKGSVFKKGETSDALYQPTPLVDETDDSRMFHMLFSEEVTNSWFRALHSLGKVYTINKNSDPEKYAKLKDHMKAMAGIIGKEFNTADDVELQVKSAEAPTGEYKKHASNPERGTYLSMKLDVTMKVRPGAANEVVIHGVMAAKGELFFEFDQEKSDDFGMPVGKLDYKITSMEVSDVTGVEIPAAKKQDVLNAMREKVQAFVTKRLEKLMEMEREAMSGYHKMKMGSIKDFYYKVHDKTFEMGFSVQIDVDKLLALAEESE